MKKLDLIAGKVAKLVSPTDKEAREEKAFALELSEKLSSELKGTEIKFVGSAARDTGLKGDYDIDLFACFHEGMKEEVIVEKTFGAARKIHGSWEMRYAEHPYLQAKINGYKVEVVPCFKITPNSRVKSAVDRSPLHMDYLQSHLSTQQRSEVRALKQLLKSHKLYGAEAEVKGFSGLACEQLLLNYRSLSNLSDKAAHWAPQEIIDLNASWKGREEEVRKKFAESPLILIDVIDSNRNAAAAISEENFWKFVLLMRALSKKPSLSLFFRKEKIISKAALERKLEERKTYFAALSYPKPDMVEDNLFPQLRKSAHALEKYLKEKEAVPINSLSFCTSGRCVILFEFTDSLLPEIRVVKGPPISQEKACEEFAHSHKKNWRGPFIRDGRLVVEVRRGERSISKIISQALKKKQLGIPPSLHSLSSEVKVFEGKGFRKMLEDKECLTVISSFFSRNDLESK